MSTGDTIARKFKVARLDGDLLDAAVAKAERLRVHIDEAGLVWRGKLPYRPSTFLEQSEPIFSREGIRLFQDKDGWHAAQPAHGKEPIGHGPSPLVAGLRAHLTRKFGDEVEL